MINVLVVGVHDAIGGVEKIVFDYITHISPRDVRFSFVNEYEKICFQDILEQRGCAVYRLPNAKRNPPGYAGALRRLLRERDFDIVHVNMLSAANILPLIVARAAGRGIVAAHSHNSDLPSSVVKRLLHRLNRRLAASLAHVRFACSREAGLFLFGGRHPFTVVRNAVDVEKYVFNEQSREALRRRLGIPDDVFVVGHIGRFAEQKNHWFLLDVFHEIVKRRDKALLLLVGEGALMEAVRGKAARLGIAEKVVFYGTTGAAGELYSGMDAFAFPSL